MELAQAVLCRTVKHIAHQKNIHKNTINKTFSDIMRRMLKYFTIYTIQILQVDVHGDIPIFAANTYALNPHWSINKIQLI